MTQTPSTTLTQPLATLRNPVYRYRDPFFFWPGLPPGLPVLPVEVRGQPSRGHHPLGLIVEMNIPR